MQHGCTSASTWGDVVGGGVDIQLPNKRSLILGDCVAAPRPWCYIMDIEWIYWLLGSGHHRGDFATGAKPIAALRASFSWWVFLEWQDWHSDCKLVGS